MLNSVKYYLYITAATSLLFIPFLGGVHLFDWDEINFAECAREMLVSGNWNAVTIDFEPFWEKPPLFIWLQASMMKIFGVSEFAARLPNALCGIVTCLVTFGIGKKLYNVQFAFLWVLSFVGSFLPHFYFKSGIIDPWFNLLIFSCIYFLVLYRSQQKLKSVVFAAVLIGVATLTKGPAAVLILGLCAGAYWVSVGFKNVITKKHLFVFIVVASLVGSGWFILLLLTGNQDIISEFFLYQVRLFNTQDSGHGGPFIYHWIVLLFGCFPASIFAIKGLKKTKGLESSLSIEFKKWMAILFWVVLLLFSIVQTKIVHYSSLCYFPISYLSAYTAYGLIKGELKWKTSMSIMAVVVSTTLALVLSVLPFIDKYKGQIINSGVIRDKFAVENLKADVYWSGFEWLLGLFFLVIVLMSLLLIHRYKIQKGIVLLFVGSMFTINVASILIVPKVEKYSQGAAIEFYKSLIGKDCYIMPLGFKSYAHLYYSKKQPKPIAIDNNLGWYLNGEVDKPTYFVAKITSKQHLQDNYPHLKVLYEKNGFVFYTR